MSKELIEFVREHIAYSPSTGDLVWRILDTGKPGRPRKQGDITSRKTRKDGAVCRRVRLGTGNFNNKSLPSTHAIFMIVEGIYPPEHGLEVDHINHDPSDDRWDNLRLVTKHQNIKNRRHKPRADNGTGLPACVRPYEYKDGTTRYSYVGRVDGVWHTSKNGEFETPEEASEAWIKVKKEKGGFY